MYYEAPEFFVDQGFYDPTAANYGYVTGFESAGNWEEHNMVFGLDGQDIQYNGAATNENLPYIYYTPYYGYGHSAYNPYNPYIPGAMIGVDGLLVAPQHYYVLPSYENTSTSPAYMPIIVPHAPDTNANGVADSLVNTIPYVDQTGSHIAKHKFPSNLPKSSQNEAGNVMSQINGGQGKQPVRNIASGRFPSQASSQVLQGRAPKGIDDDLSKKTASATAPVKTVVPSANGLSGFESMDHLKSSSVDKVKPKPSSKQNQGPKTNTSKNQLVVKAYSTRAGKPDALGNIIIFRDQCNTVDFPLNYVNAKFFVIKSFSEDDVHKSVKYNMWSSTPNGNKKLNAEYEDAQKIAARYSKACPIFLFFSVNASGQFCGVAEMIGPVDFDKNMDFWQQDKWSGSFPVKWHFVKDLPNPYFRHIILETNENRPVTNSRDTQEISFKKGLEMLRIFKNYTLKTSLFDDFMFYENRQRIMKEERARLLIKCYENPHLVTLVDPPRKLQNIHDFPSIGGINVTKQHDTTIQNKNNFTVDFMKNPSVLIRQLSLNNNVSNSTDQVLEDGVEIHVNELKINSLIENSSETESEGSFAPTNNPTTENREVADVVTIGSMPVNVKGACFSDFWNNSA